jgi:hypothetical protein
LEGVIKSRDKKKKKNSDRNTEMEFMKQEGLSYGGGYRRGNMVKDT